MWTLVAMFCELAGPNKGVCSVVIPPITFTDYESCMDFGLGETTSINLQAVTYDYQCIAWNNKT